MKCVEQSQRMDTIITYLFLKILTNICVECSDGKMISKGSQKCNVFTAWQELSDCNFSLYISEVLRTCVRAGVRACM